MSKERKPEEGSVVAAVGEQPPLSTPPASYLKEHLWFCLECTKSAFWGAFGGAGAYAMYQVAIYFNHAMIVCK